MSASSICASYGTFGGRTSVQRIYEAGSLRLRHPRGKTCEAILVNTAGGVVAGDWLEIDVDVGPAAVVTLSSAAAEKIYRSEGALARITNRLTLAPKSDVAWIPQETIIFDGAQLRRHFQVDLADDASFVAAELFVFGRAASGERNISGSFHDSWRVRRAGRVVFADETRLDGRISAVLTRTAVGNGACASALVLVAQPDAEARLDPIRAAIDGACRTTPIEGGASLKDGIIVARFVAQSSEHLRRAVAAVLGVAGGLLVPRVWQ